MNKFSGLLTLFFLTVFTGVLAQEASNSDSLQFAETQDSLAVRQKFICTAVGLAVCDLYTNRYQVQKSKLQSIEDVELVTSQETNLLHALSGRLNGVQIVRNDQLGGSAQVLMRGVNFFEGNNQPLVVVDGIPLKNADDFVENSMVVEGYDYGDIFQDINVEDIAQVRVISGVAASAKYGMRGINGVIEIETKEVGYLASGKLQLEVSSSTSIQQPLILPLFQNTYGGGYNGQFKGETPEGYFLPNYEIDESWGPALEGQPIIDWQGNEASWEAQPDNLKDFLQTGVTTSNHFALTGGNPSKGFRLSYTNLYQKGILPNALRNRHHLNYSGIWNINERWDLGAKGSFSVSDVKGRAYNGNDSRNVMYQLGQWHHRQLDMEKLKAYKNEDGSPNHWNVEGDGNPMYFNNPYWTQYENAEQDGRQRFFGKMYAKFALTPDLSIEGNVSLDRFSSLMEEKVAIGSVETSMYQSESLSQQEMNANAVLSYSNYSGDFVFSGQAAYQYTNRQLDYDFRRTRGGLITPDLYSIDNSVQQPELNASLIRQLFHSVYATGAASYRDMLFGEATLRGEWHEDFAGKTSFLMHKAVSGGFAFSALGNLADSDVLTYGAIQLNWGSIKDHRDLIGNGYKPARLDELEAKLDLQFFRRRLGLNVNLYKRTTSNIASSVRNLAFLVVLNDGEMSNNGVELNLNATPVRNSDTKWEIGLNLSHNKNEVLVLSEQLDDKLLAGMWGSQLLINEGQPYGSIYGKNYVYDQSGQIQYAANGLPLQSNEYEQLGNIMPDWTGGIYNRWSYKHFSLSALIDFRKGGELISFTNYWGRYAGVLQETAENGIREDGMNLNGVTVPAEIYFKNLPVASAVYDASYVKLREVSLTYRLPEQLEKRLRLNDFNISITGRNLGVLYKQVPHIDPEVAMGAHDMQGVELGQLPSLRSYGFRVNFKI